MQPAVFLDRDNTLILNDGDLGDPEKVRIVDGVARGLRELREAGYNVIVVTNQGGVARGKYTEADVDAVHQRIATLVDEAAGVQGLIDRFYYCPYHPEATLEEYKRDHPWRKPHPGMLLQAARDMDLDLSSCWMIGDQERDIQAGRSAGCRTVLVAREAAALQTQPTVLAKSFGEAVRSILAQKPGAGFSAGRRNGASRAVTGTRRADPDSSSRDAASLPTGAGVSISGGTAEALRRSVHDLTEELRSERLRRAEFTFFRMAAIGAQLLAVLTAALGMINLSDMNMFLKWMIGAVFAQLAAIAMLLLDLKA